MGLGVVLLLWAAFGTVAAGVGMWVFGGITRFLTRGVEERGRRRVWIAASAFPVLCLGWAAAIFVFQAVVNEGFLHRDLGLGDSWYCPLPNGYQLEFIDVTDQGSVYNPKTQPAPDSIASQQDAVMGVRQLQVAGPYLFGAADTKTFDHYGAPSTQVDLYFALDTRNGQRTDLSQYDDLVRFASQSGNHLKLEPVYNVYSRYRFTRFDIFAGLLFIVPPTIGFISLVAWIVRLRRTRIPLDPEAVLA